MSAPPSRRVRSEPSPWRWIPHALSLARVPLVIATYDAAMRLDEAMFAVLVLSAVLTDVMDGPLARHLGTAGRLGSNVDSLADLVFYLSLPVWAWLFRPEVIWAQRYMIATLSVLYVAVNILAQLKFGALGVHNRLSRASGTIGVVGAFYTILWGLEPWLYVLILVTLAADLAQRYGALVRANFGQAQDVIGKR